MEIKHAKKRQKGSSPGGGGGEHWLALVTRYGFLFAGVVCHCVILLLLAMVLTLHDASGQRYQSMLDVLAIFLVVLLVLVWQLRWTYPLSNEVPLLILLLWIVLSYRISPTHCFCCHPPPTVTDASALSALGVDAEQAAMVATGVSADDEVDAKLSTAAIETDDFLMEHWRWAMSDCRAEHFNFFFSVLCLVMVLCAFMTEVRSSVGSLLFRLCTAALVALVAVLFFVSPSLCSKFSIELSDSFVTVVRITLFEALWALNRYGRGCERLLLHAYQYTVQVTQRHLLLEARASDKGLSVPAHIADYQFSTPRAHTLQITKVYHYIAQRYHASGDGGGGGTRKRKQKPQKGGAHSLLLPMGRSQQRGRQAYDEDDDDDAPVVTLRDLDEDGYSDEEYEESDDERVPHRLQGALPPVQPQSPQDLAAAEEKRRSLYVMTEVWGQLCELSHSYRRRYLGGILSWKNRGYSKHLLYLVDLAICLWVLLVCPPWLWLAPLEIIWLLYYIYLCKYELAGTQAQSAILSRVVAQDDALIFGVSVLSL